MDEKTTMGWVYLELFINIIEPYLIDREYFGDRSERKTYYIEIVIDRRASSLVNKRMT